MKMMRNETSSSRKSSWGTAIFRKMRRKEVSKVEKKITANIQTIN